MYNRLVLTLKIVYITFLILSAGFVSEIIAQDAESVYLNRRVVDVEGDQLSDRSESEVSLTAFLNGQKDSVLTEDAPRWEESGSSWDAANSLIGVELQNFHHFSAGDTAHLRFVDLTTGRSGSTEQLINDIPWSDPDPFANIQLGTEELPERPQNVTLDIDVNYNHSITWNGKEGQTYEVYRRTRQDTLNDGRERNVFVKLADNIDGTSYTDTATDTSFSYAYIVYARSGDGSLSAHSEEVRGTKPGALSESILITKRVENSNGQLIERLPPLTSYTAYLNDSKDSILTEKAPRLGRNEKTISAINSTFNIELTNFPDFDPGDTAHVRFTDTEIEEQGTYSTVIDELPWEDPNPLNSLTLQSVSLPPRPDNVSLDITDDNDYTVSWDQVTGYSYTIFRRVRQDTLDDGRARHLYIKLAEGIESDHYTDTNTQDSLDYAYIVYAVGSEGRKSAHSSEVKEQFSVEGVHVESRKATNVTLGWDSFNYLGGRVAGYNIYRRREGESYDGQPVSYEDREPRYTDSRLEPGGTYYYKIKARDIEGNEVSESGEVQVTTRSSTDDYMTYANLKTAVVLYRHGPSVLFGGSYRMSDDEVEDMKFLIEKVREFFWRNTEMQFNLEVEYIEFDEYLELNDNRSTSPSQTGQHLVNKRGVINTQYDIVFRLTPSVGGYWSWGATDRLDLPGPERRTGFAQMRWPYSSPQGFDEGYPAYFPNIDYNRVGNKLIWTFTHEIQHAIDGVYDHNGHPEMGHGDNPQFYGLNEIDNTNIGCCYPGFPKHYTKRFGRRFDFQSTMLRDFRPYKELLPVWGDIYEAKDKDGDGMPDRDPRVPFDEERFGTDASQADTDGDGYTDKQEATDGIFEYSTTNPRKTDTDNDGITDGEDNHPRYPIDTRIKTTAENFVPTVDGKLEEWPEHALVNDTVSKVERDRAFAPKFYMAYSSDSLYVALNIPVEADPVIRWDFGDNGFWYGPGNTTMEVNTDQGSFSQLRTWDASPEARDLKEQISDDVAEFKGDGVWDNSSAYRANIGSRIFNSNEINLKTKSRSAGAGHSIEIAIPEKEKANLTLEQDERIGVQVDYNDVFGEGFGARTFDWLRYVYVELSGLKATDYRKKEETPFTFDLKQNYPNPFNPRTTIPYSIGQPGHVTLAVYNMLGRKVATLVDEHKNKGAYEVTFDAGDMSSGMYFYKLSFGSKSAIQKMLVLK